MKGPSPTTSILTWKGNPPFSSSTAATFWPSTQSFFYALAQTDESAPGIPKVYDAFCENGWCFFVMEKIATLSTCEISEDDAVQSVAPIVKWLLAFVPPSIFGRISSEVASLGTTTLSQSIFICPGKIEEVHLFFGRSRHLSSDIRKDNFLHDTKTKKTWIVDFQHIGLLPEPFQVYAFFTTGNRFAAAVGACLGLRRANIANEMTWASGLLRQIGGDGSLSLASVSLNMKVAARSHDTMFTPEHVKVQGGVVQEILATVPGAGAMDTTSSPKIRKASKAKATNGHAP
ncbi:hypothetical protein EDD15DRAFT_2450650 [Pisolithus albus]|nr:hypothetical protein EDD15DRAFT_2450650 [Pisolithus albus]